MRSACDEAPMSSVSPFLPAHAAHPSANLALHDVHPTGCSRLLRVLCSLVINTHVVLLCRSHAVRVRGHPQSRPPSQHVSTLANTVLCFFSFSSPLHTVLPRLCSHIHCHTPRFRTWRQFLSDLQRSRPCSPHQLLRPFPVRARRTTVPSNSSNSATSLETAVLSSTHVLPASSAPVSRTPSPPMSST